MRFDVLSENPRIFFANDFGVQGDLSDRLTMGTRLSEK
jgi:hypothetical protein